MAILQDLRCRTYTLTVLKDFWSWASTLLSVPCCWSWAQAFFSVPDSGCRASTFVTLPESRNRTFLTGKIIDLTWGSASITGFTVPGREKEVLLVALAFLGDSVELIFEGITAYALIFTLMMSVLERECTNSQEKYK